jgi:lactate permease
LFGTLIGWLGVALTGADAGSNALFGSLQVITANKLGLNPVPMAAANSAGGVMGKMIDAQSIIVACVAVNLVGKEGDVFRAVLVHSILLALIVGVIVTLYPYVFPGVLPIGAGTSTCEVTALLSTSAGVCVAGIANLALRPLCRSRRT